MALEKRAKKFRQKHLSGKLEQKKREKKHADLVKSKKRKGLGSAPAAAQRIKLDVPQEELFDAEESNEPSNFENYLSDDEDDEDDEEIAAEEADYLEDDGADLLPSSALLPEVIDAKQVKEWKQQLQKSPKPLAQIVRAGTHDEVARFTGPDALDNLRDVLLTGVPAAVKQFYPDPKQIKGVRSTFKELADVLVELLNDLGGADADALSNVISCVALLLPYFTAFGREYRQIIKGLTAVIVHADRDDKAKLLAFDAVRSANMRAEVAKIAYSALVKAAARTNSFTMEALNLAKSLFATLFVVDEEEDSKEVEETQQALYQLAFQQIRQLALHLKTALDKVKHPDFDTKVVYTWQYVQSLDFWSRCIALSPRLRALVHPLCQVTLRVITLVPNQKYLPLRFYLVRALVRVGRHTGVYIPLAPHLLDSVLHSSTVLSKQARKAALSQPDFDALLHVPGGYIGTQVYQNSVLDEFCDVLVESLVLYTKSIAFPELVIPVTVAVRRFVKHDAQTAVNPRIRQTLNSLCERIDANTQYILKHRATVSFGPRDKAAVDRFLADVKWEDTPLGKEAVARRKVREERRRLAKEGLEEIQGGSDDDGEIETDKGEMEEALQEELEVE